MPGYYSNLLSNLARHKKPWIPILTVINEPFYSIDISVINVQVQLSAYWASVHVIMGNCFDFAEGVGATLGTKRFCS